MQYFLVSLRKENFEKLKESNFDMIGFPEKYRLIDRIELGEKFVLFVGSGKSLVVGILESTGKIYRDNNLFWDDYFPKRVKTKVHIILEEEKYVSMRQIKDGLSFINPDVKKFGVYLMKGVRKLSEEDYKYLYEKVVQK